MADSASDTVLTVLAVLLAASAATAALLTRRAVRHWRGERAGAVYELPVDHRGIARRAGAAGGAALLSATLAFFLLDATRHPDPATTPAAHAAATSTRSVPPPTPAAPSARTPTVPPPPPRTPQPAPPPPEFRTVGHPAGGTLQILGDGTRVWLPPLYDSRRAARIAYPVVVVRMAGDAAGQDKALYEGFARAAQKKKADLFVLVVPAGCDRDARAVLAQAARRYRLLPGRRARGLLGIGPQAPCAVREALSTRDTYGAAAAASGTYPKDVKDLKAVAPLPGEHPTLLLTTAAGESGPRASALRLRTALRGPGDPVRLVDGIGRRRDMFALIAGFMTEKLDGPARSTPPPAPASTPPSRPAATRTPSWPSP